MATTHEHARRYGCEVGRAAPDPGCSEEYVALVWVEEHDGGRNPEARCERHWAIGLTPGTRIESAGYDPATHGQPPVDGETFYTVAAQDADHEWPPSTARLLTLPGSDEVARFHTEEEAREAMVEWCSTLRGAWWLDVERRTWRAESEPGIRGLSWWEQDVDQRYDGPSAWWNSDDGRVEVE